MAGGLAHALGARGGKGERIVIAFTIPGETIPKERARSGRGHFYTPQATRDFQEYVRWLALEAMQGRPPIEGPVTLTVTFYLGSLRRAKVVDLTNAVKGVEDGMNLIVYKDDRQIWEEHIEKAVCIESPRAEVRVEKRGNR